MVNERQSLNSRKKNQKSQDPYENKVNTVKTSKQNDIRKSHDAYDDVNTMKHSNEVESPTTFSKHFNILK